MVLVIVDTAVPVMVDAESMKDPLKVVLIKSEVVTMILGNVPETEPEPPNDPLLGSQKVPPVGVDWKVPLVTLADPVIELSALWVRVNVTVPLAVTLNVQSLRVLANDPAPPKLPVP